MLKSLQIERFRMLRHFEVQSLGRLNLIVGKNNSGKSTVLDAIRIYAGGANRSLLETIASEHDEKYTITEEDLSKPGGPASLPYSSFFTGRKYPDEDGEGIFIGGWSADPEAVRIAPGLLVETEEASVDAEGAVSTKVTRRRVSRSDLGSLEDQNVSQALFIAKGERFSYRLRLDMESARVRATFQDLGLSTQQPCAYIPTRFVSLAELAEDWDAVVLTEDEAVVREALKLISEDFEGLAFVRDGKSYRPARGDRGDRVARVKLAGVDEPVPLRSMGDGIVRILQLVLKVFTARGGFLLIDEFENGLHFGVQEKVWDLLFRLAARLDVQVFATTHSWDCIESFAKVARARTEINGALFRVGVSVRSRDRGNVVATTFTEEELWNLTQSDVEVR